ncbi:sodium/proton antiporter, NhaA family [Lutibacter agarilyticus]|uniref:Na(+)/H(+) antiporter NhaA n=1 Tax=Lutibacter agarilyticus TaxID=1109740 RepID=A0A238YI15_9FLAO|nr:Na+/H+ antiporter NhaA [Lutibacter agarilyticus]SNR70029.1 sodium/proton antiporter, NhaA family [Lutibacter agarilyticus]
MKRISVPLKNFIQKETSSSIILFAVSIIAIVWANSSYGYIYEDLWHHKFTIGFADNELHLSKPLILWINDGLMAVFFFVIGLEVKREVLLGELTTLRKASLPIFAAIGGMLFPVLIFLFLNNGKIGGEGWGIPMATDIAFTLGILTILGKRVPLGLKIFLTAFAIVDDIGAVIVIAIFYSSNIQWDLLLYAMILIGFVGFLSYKKIYSQYFYYIIGFIVWFLFLKSGVHPTISGVLMAFTFPITRSVDLGDYLKSVTSQLSIFNVAKEEDSDLLDHDEIKALDSVEYMSKQLVSPLQHLEHTLHGWVSYLIMPIFALANAGVVISFEGLGAFSHISYNVALALVFGNTIGIMLLSFFAIKLKWADLPENVNYVQLFGVSLLGGLGFTMSLFISNLAFEDENLVTAAKMGVIIGSLVAGALGYIVLRLSLKVKKY